MYLTTPDFQAYGFELRPSDIGQFISYGPDGNLWLEHAELMRVPRGVLFSVFRADADGIELTVGPSLLDMPFEPPFLYAATDPAEIHAIIDDHRRRADRLTFQHERIAEYLALRHINRLLGDALDERDVAFITRLELAYEQKLRMLLLN